MEFVALDGESSEFLVGDLDPLRIGVFIKAGLDAQPFARRRAADQIHDNLAADQRPAAPVGGDVAEYSGSRFQDTGLRCALS